MKQRYLLLLPIYLVFISTYCNYVRYTPEIKFVEIYLDTIQNKWIDNLGNIRARYIIKDTTFYTFSRFRRKLVKHYLFSNFDTINFESEFLNFSNSVFQNNFSFYHAKCNSLISRNSYFNSISNLASAKLKDLAIQNSTFKKSFNFQYGSVLNYGVIRNSEFNKEALFNGTFFIKFINFSNNHFYDKTKFIGTEFHDLVYFSGSNFLGELDFSFGKFEDEVYFQNSKFYENVYFIGTSFNLLLDLSNCIFHEQVYFVGSQLPWILNLNGLRSEKIIDFSLSTPPKNGKCKIYLRNSEIEKIRIDYTKFKLGFYPLDSGFEKKQVIYERLLNNFKRDGMKESYQLLDKEYKNFVYLNKIESSNLILKLYWFIIQKVDKYWWNFGYNKERIFFWTFSFFLLFVFLNWLYGITWLNEKVYTIENLLSRIKLLKVQHTFLFSFFYTFFIFFGLKMSFEHLQFNHKRFVLLILIEYIIGIICLAYLINFVISK